MTHTRMCHGNPVSLVKMSFLFIQVKIIQALDFDNWHPLNACIYFVSFFLSHGSDVSHDSGCRAGFFQG